MVNKCGTMKIVKFQGMNQTTIEALHYYVGHVHYLLLV